MLVRTGPLGSRRKELQLVRGAGTFKQTSALMGIVINAALEGGAEGLPIPTAVTPGDAAG